MLGKYIMNFFKKIFKRKNDNSDKTNNDYIDQATR